MTALLVALLAAAHATPIQLDHQLRVLDAAGAPLVGAHELELSLHADGSTATALWSERQTVTLSDGYATLALGADTDDNPLHDALFDGSPRYLQVARVVGGTAQPLLPRRLLATVPYAAHAANVSGGVVQLSADAAACTPARAGRLRWDDRLEVCDGVAWRVVAQQVHRSCQDIYENEPFSQDGTYTVDPDGSGELQVYCDFRSTGGWTLLMRITGTGNAHVESNAAVGDSPCLPSSGQCRVSTATIDRFVAVPGRQVFEIDPEPSSYMSWYVGTSDDTDRWPTNLECDNRPALAASADWSWILTAYSSLTNATNGTSGDTGDYTGANHYYPTPYSNEQLFFGVNNGMRANPSWSSSGYVDGQSGFLWMR